MRELWGQIREAIERRDYIIGAHAALRLRQRHVPIWQAVGASPNGRLLVERQRAKPNPVVEVEILLADGTSAKAVWSWIARDSTAKLVTVHFIDR